MGPLGFPRGVGAWFLHPVGLMGLHSPPHLSHTLYRIHHHGLIEKTPPAQPEKDEGCAYYIYVDAAGKEHDFGSFAGEKAIRWIRKGIKGSEEIYLVNASDLGNNPARKFGFRFTTTQRKYLNQTALASLIGALMEVGYEDIVSTGFSMADGSSGVSNSHINGESGDFRVLRTDRDWNTPTHLNTAPGVDALDEERQAAFNEALYKFGWHSQLAWLYTKNGKRKLLPRTQHYLDHHHHLHIGRFRPDVKER